MIKVDKKETVIQGEAAELMADILGIMVGIEEVFF